MQDLIKRGASRQKLSATEVDLKSSAGRRDSMAKLLETATHMLKNGATPAVLEFVNTTTTEIYEGVLPEIEDEHATAQAFLNDRIQEFHDARDALERERASIESLGVERHANIASLKQCRAEESVSCALARQCNSDLMKAWHEYEAEESKMRRHHSRIHDEWCVHPPDAMVLVEDPFNWPDISPYPVLEITGEIQEFRSFSETEFQEYIDQKPIVEAKWATYEAKLEECATISATLEEKTDSCDEQQEQVETSVCTHAIDARNARSQFGDAWATAGFAYRTAVAAITEEEADRKHEYENLHIVMCLLSKVSEHVQESIETGQPCITETTDAERTHLEVENCHAVTEGLTAHLVIDYGTPPEMPSLPDIHNFACTAEYLWEEQGSNAAQVGDTLSPFAEFYAAPGAAHAHDTHGAHHVSHNVEVSAVSAMGWGSCAAPKVCNPTACAALRPQTGVVEEEPTGSHECRAHESHLVLGELTDKTFRCLDGTCVKAETRCNGHSNCADGSDEQGCSDTVADLTQATTCPAESNPFTSFQCTDGSCIPKGARCNGVNNCADGSDETGCHCLPLTGITVEATSGRAASVETYAEGMEAFQDRSYTLSGGTDFIGKTMIKFSNADKSTPGDHVMLRINADVAVNVWVMKFEDQTLNWLRPEQGWTHSDVAGVVVSHQSGVRYRSEEFGGPQRTWVQWSATEGEAWASSPAQVWHKTFPAGTISLAGNGHNDGSYLVFLDEPCPEHPMD